MTTLYVTGTVSVTAGNRVVTGVGTGWQTALIVGGLFGLDVAGGAPVPIRSIDSDTSLTLEKPWRGASASAQDYWIIRDTSAGRQAGANANALAAIINALGSPALAALAGLAPASDKVPYFSSSGAAALADIRAKGRDILAVADSAAAYATLGEIPNAQIPARIRQLASAVSTAGALNSITETGVVAVTTTGAVATVGGPDGAPAGVCLTIMSAGTDSGVQTYYGYSGSADRSWTRRKLSNVWQPWQLTSIPIVGTVSQVSGGQPFGAMMERGRNANGDYVRFADGTQICTHQLNGTAVIDESVRWTYPVAFSTTTGLSISATAWSSSAQFIRLAHQAAYTTTTFDFFSWAITVSNSAIGGSSVTHKLMAIGKWF